MPAQKYEIELSDGRKFVVETEGGPPSEQDILASLGSQPAAEAAPSPEAQHEGPAESYTAGAGRGFKQGLLDLINIPAHLRTVGAVARFPERVIRAGVEGVMKGDPSEAVALKDDAVNMAKGVGQLGRAAIGLDGAEAMGEAHGGLLPGLIPVGGLAGSGLRKFGQMDRSKNLVKAAGVSKPANIAKIERLVAKGRLKEVPIAGTRTGFIEKLDEIAKKSAGPQLDKVKAKLRNIPPVSVEPSIEALKAERQMTKGLPQQVTVQPRTPAGFTAQKPAPVTKTVIPEGSGNPALVSALNKQIDELVRLAGVEKKMSADQIQKFKEQAQSAGKYTAAPGTGAKEASAAQAAEAAGKVMLKTLETSTDIPKGLRNELIAANHRMEDLNTLRKPAVARRLADAKKGLVSRSIEGLVGRAALPAVAAGGLTGSTFSPLGAAIGVGAGAFTQSVLFNTLSASAKLQVAKIMQSRGVEAAMQAAFASHITSNASRRQNDAEQ